MKMTTDEIIKRINDKLEDIIRFGGNIIHGKIFVHSTYKDVKFDLRNVEPKNTGEFLDWFIVTKEQAADVITKYSERNDYEMDLKNINTFIIENNLSEDKVLYLAPYLPDV